MSPGSAAGAIGREGDIVIKAYHQVGSEDWEPEEREETLREIIERGEIEPAIERLDRGEMEAECFSDPERGATLRQRFEGASQKLLLALEAIARKKIAKLPESGFTHSLFNCVDLIAGDLEVVFLKPEGWYSVPTGFVFDAEKLIAKGARYRDEDLLGGYTAAIEGAADMGFRSVEDARRHIERELADIHKYFESTGRAALEKLREWKRGRRASQDFREIVWKGRLPLAMATEAWLEGEEVTNWL